MFLKNLLPQVYSQFLSKEFLSLPIHETKATCDNCLRSRDKRFEYLYKSHLKCCTFFPFLPNYAVGGILQLNLPAASVVKHKISNQNFSLPLGIFPDLDYQFRFQNKKDKDFGNKENLLCPYYLKDTQNCGIWQFRGTVCTTYYCRSDFGEKGLDFWRKTNDFLSYLEMALAEECLVMMDFSPRDISNQLQFLNKKDFNLRERGQKTLADGRYKKFWNGYDNPEHFYKMCYEMVSQIKKSQFSEILGEKGAELHEKVIDQFQKLK